MWYSLIFINRRASLLGFFIGHARGGTLLYIRPNGSISDAVRLMSAADLYDALDDILLGSDAADLVIQRLPSLAPA
jgi:hypothetical protein